MSFLSVIKNQKINKAIFFLILIASIFTASITLCCNKSQNTSIAESENSEIRQEENRALEILKKLFVAEKRFAVSNGQYAQITDLRKKGLFKIDETELTNSGYTFRIEFSGVKEIKIFVNPKDYKNSGVISYFVDQTGKIRGGDHSGGDGSSNDPEV